MAILLLSGVPSADAQEPSSQWVPRGEMIGAIISFAANHCGSLDGLLAALVEPYCKDPTAGWAVHMTARMALASYNDEALRDLCRKHGIAECQTQQTTSRGQPILVPDITAAVRPHIASWSPDNRFLLFQDGGAVPRILDTASGHLVDKALHKWRAEAFAWSPDGQLAALSSFSGIRVLSVGSWEDVATKLPNNEGCRFQGQRHMAFTADSRSLWVLCSNFRSPQARVAQKLSVPELKVEDEVLLSPVPGAARTAFQAVAIARHADDVIVTGTLYQYGETGDLQRGGGTIALSLTRKQPVYPPLAAYPFIKHSGDLSRVLLYTVRPTGASDKHGNVPIEWAVETWDAASGTQLGKFSGTTDADSTRKPPVAVPMSNLLIAAYRKRSSSRGMLVVMDDRSGAVLQEIGPMPSVQGIVVSSDGSRAAIFGHEETRIYKIDR